MKADNASSMLKNLNLNLNLHQQTKLAESNDPNKNILSPAMIEFLENSAMSEEKRKSRAKNLEKLQKILMENVGMLTPSSEIEDLLKNIKLDNKSINLNMNNLNLNAFLTDENEFTNELINELTFKQSTNGNGNEKINNMLAELNRLRPDSELYQKLFDAITNVEQFYVTPYQQVAEVLSEMYSAFATINVAISSMISSGKPNSENNTIAINIAGLQKALLDLYTLFHEPTSPLVVKLKAMQFTPADKAKGLEMVEGTGLILAGGPPGNTHYWVEVDRSTWNNLNAAYSGLIKNTPGTLDISITTYALQALQTAISSVGEQSSSNMLAGTEKYKRAISQADNFTRLLNTFMSTNHSSNLSFLTNI